MRNFTIQNDLNEDFWNKYANLWQNSKDKSPFQGPEILKFLASNYNDTVAALLFDNQNLIGATLLKNENNIYAFLSDRKSDANWFVFHNKSTEEDIEYFFNSFFTKIRDLKWTLILNKVKSWAENMNQLESSGKNSNLFWQNLQYSVCPALEADSPEDLFAKINRSRQFRYAVNRLHKQHSAIFEIFHDDTDLEDWVKEFCQCHIKRWNNTSTPSEFRDNSKQLFLLKCLKAWNNDNNLIRFSVKIKDTRIGFSINLKEGNTLIGHSTTYDPEFKKLSPGKSLLYIMAQWMKDNNIRVFDFGNGDEEYKYSLANKEQFLKRIFISPKKNILFIIKSKIIKVIRSENRLYWFYKNKIKLLFKNGSPENTDSIGLNIYENKI
jgi:hypothetical protein